MSANDKVRDIEEHAAAKAETLKAKVDRQQGLGIKHHKVTVEPFDTSSIPSGTFEAATLRPPKLPDVSVAVSVDTILGVDAQLRNAIFQMGLGDTEGVRRCIQSAISKLQPAFEETGKALTRLKSKPSYVTLGTRSIKDDISRDIKLSPDMSIPLPRGTSIEWPAANPSAWCFDLNAVRMAEPVIAFVAGSVGTTLSGEAYCYPRGWIWANGIPISGRIVAWQPMPAAPLSIPDAPKGSPARFPASWGQELGD